MGVRTAVTVRVQGVMTEEVRSCTPNTPLSDSAAILWDRDRGALPVIEDGKVAGITTDRDICIALGTRDRLPHTVPMRDAGTRPVVTCGPEDERRKVLELKRQYQIRRIPVVDAEQRLRGIVSINDIVLRAEGRRSKELSHEEVIKTMKAVSAHRT